VGGRTAAFVRDVRRGRVLLASRATGGQPAAEDSGCPSLARRGRVVAFDSAARLDPSDDDAFDDVFVRGLAWPE
jgi:hypothetical protein